MTTGTKTVKPGVKHELVITRIFNAPRELVFETWIDKKHLKRWWGPRDFTNPFCETDPRPGGKIRIDMQGPGFPVHPMGGVYKEIKRPERLVFTTTAFFNSSGVPSIENLNTVTFEKYRGNKTKLTLHVTVLKSSPEVQEALEGMETGWTQSLEKLDSLLKTIQA